MKRAAPVLSLLSLLLAAACTQAKFLAVNAPTWFDDLVVHRDVSYGANPGQKLDVYAPPPEKSGRPVVVFFYGGRWTKGSKSDYRFVAARLAAKGFVVVVPDYRKYPDVRFPVFVEDGAKAVAWVARHIADYGGNPARLHVSGHSSGAHIGALIASDPRYLKAEGKTRSIISSFSGLAGPYAFTPEADDLKEIFGPPEKYPLMRAPTYVDGRQPPMLLLHGASDDDVGAFNLEKLAAAIHEKGGCVKTKIYPGIDHVDIIAAFSWYGRGKAPVEEDMTAFLLSPACFLRSR